VAELKAAYTPEQQSLDSRLRAWRKQEAARNGRPAFFVLSDANLHSLVVASPRNLRELATVPGFGPGKIDAYGEAILAECNAAGSSGELVASVGIGMRSPPQVEGQRPSVRPNITAAATKNGAESSSAAQTLTRDQQLLDQSLREWRRAEAEKRGLPQFFILGSSALRGIVLTRPKTVAQLQTIEGIGAEKAEKYGAGILSACNI
jgi:ATP-dependent DNA helicase RecQ